MVVSVGFQIVGFLVETECIGSRPRCDVLVQILDIRGVVSDFEGIEEEFVSGLH